MDDTTYNFDARDIADENYSALYSRRRRDAIFAFSIPKDDGSLILGRDHLGNVPLFYRFNGNTVKSSVFIERLLVGNETISEEGLRVFLSVGTAKVSSLFNEIFLVPPGTVLRVSPEGKSEKLYEYHITPSPIKKSSLSALVARADQLLTQAAKRTLKRKSIGLYLSGGIDSTLTGIYLKKAGANINAYTAMPWGTSGSELRFAKENAGIIGIESHDQKPLKTDEYDSYIQSSYALYGNPVGAASQMAISCLLKSTLVGQEEQIYFAQNCDTATCSVPDQSLLYFTHFLPQFIQKRLHNALQAKRLVDKYTTLRTAGLVKNFPFLLQDIDAYSLLQQLSLAGMLFGHTPIDGDIILLSSIKRGSLVSNLFYDMDVVEFSLGIPLRHRLGWSHESKIGLSITKKVFKELAKRHLIPKATIQRKKGLTIPINRDEDSKNFFSSLPRNIGKINLHTPHQRLAAETLKRWANQLSVCPKSLRALFQN